MPFGHNSPSPGDMVLREAPPAPCVRCGARMSVTRIAPLACGRDLRTFECGKCGNTEQYRVEYGTSQPWIRVNRQH